MTDVIAPFLTEFLLQRISEEELTARLADDDRAITRCEASRRIVDIHRRHHAGTCTECVSKPILRVITKYAPWPCPTLRVMAEVYADSLDYRDEWRPMYEELEGL